MWDFVVLNGMILGAVVAYILWRRPRKPTVLNLKGATSTTSEAQLTKNSSSQPHPKSPKGSDLWEDQKEKTPGKALNVIFNYNGHDWDAYEVLGLPAGSSPQKVEEAYQRAISQVEESSRTFLTTAYQAILNQQRSASS